MIITQISTFLENVAGRLADVATLFADNHINLRAMSIADTTDFGILRMVVDKPEEAIEILKSAGFTAKATDVLAVAVDDKPGGLAAVCTILRNRCVSIEYLYASLEQRSNKAFVIVKVNDVQAGKRALEMGGITESPRF